MFTHWWLSEMPPVSGLLRAVFYTGLLALCLWDHPSPLHAAKIRNSTQEVFYTPVGGVRLLRLRRPSARTLALVSRLTVIAWVAAAAGLAQPVSGILVFLGFAYLHNVNAGALGANHSTHAALYALFAMCFSVSYGFSVDGMLAHWLSWSEPVGVHSAFRSGFAPLLLLFFLGYTMLAGGVAKLRYGGLGWLDGRALRFYLEESRVAARWLWVSDQLIARPWLCRLLARATVVIELCAPLTLLSSTLRMPLILTWVALHVGILFVMMPAYYVQMWCYLLLLDWPWIVSVLSGHPQPAVASADGLGATVFPVVGVVCVLLLLFVLVRGSEEWPMTSVPMYSNGVPAAECRLPGRAELQSRALQAHRGRHTAWQRAWVADEVMEDIWATPADGGEPKRLFHLMHEEGVAGRFVRWSQYAKVVREVAIADLVAKPSGRLAADTADQELPANRFLRSLAPVVRALLPHPQRFERLDLVCRTADGEVAIGGAELTEEPVPATHAAGARTQLR